VTVRSGRIVEFDILADTERLALLDLATAATELDAPQDLDGLPVPRRRSRCAQLVRTARDDVSRLPLGLEAFAGISRSLHPVPPVLGDEHGDPSATGISASWVIRPVARMATLCVPEGPIRVGGHH
jgi:hypothetical protein